MDADGRLATAHWEGLGSAAMKIGRLCVGLAVVFLSMATNQTWAQRGRSREVAADNGWLFNFREAKQIAAETNKPLMVVFRCVP